MFQHFIAKSSLYGALFCAVAVSANAKPKTAVGSKGPVAVHNARKKARSAARHHAWQHRSAASGAPALHAAPHKPPAYPPHRRPAVPPKTQAASHRSAVERPHTALPPATRAPGSPVVPTFSGSAPTAPVTPLAYQNIPQAEAYHSFGYRNGFQGHVGRILIGWAVTLREGGHRSC